MEERSRFTLEEIAKEIGISRTTIYKVLKNKEGVSEETCRIVNEALEKYHYVQNKNARNLAMNRQYTIGYVGFRSKSANYFSTEVNKGLNRVLKEFGDDGLKLFISEFDVENPYEQRRAVQEMLEEGIENFILTYSSEEVIQDILEELESRGCQVVLLSRDVKQHPDNYYVGVDYYRSGALAAELVAKMVPGDGKIYIPVSEEYKTNQDILQRLQGFVHTIEEKKRGVILPVAYGLTKEEDIKRAVVSILNEEDPKAIFDLTYRLDMIAEILRTEKRKDVRLVGFDLFEEIRESVADETIDAVIYQDISSQAYFAAKILFEEQCYGRHREQKKHYSKLEIIMKENLIYF